LRVILERPQTGELAPLLATLQPEQYKLVTWPDTVPLVVQGHPGTGKTVIATHRAVYLTHQDRDEGPVGRVALVGPTDRHAEHVRKVIRDLDARNVRVLSLPHFLSELAGLRTQPAPTNEQRRLDTDWSLGRLVDRAVPILREAGRLQPRRSSPLRVLVDALTKHDPLLTQLIEANQELSEWLAQVGSFERASTSERFLPFLAAAQIALTPLAPATQFDHLIVDEAQDVRPLEWRILTATLRHPERVSLLGDINQRRSDWSPLSWLQLVTDLGLTDEQGRFETQVLDTGFRTTREVLRFANQLLPKSERVDRAIRTGQPPTVLQAAPGELAGAVVRESRALSARYPEGLVAVITMAPTMISDRFRKLGWKRSAIRDAWTDSERTVLVLHPASARGLEFDGVVVVEPADFPPNVGRLGLLFTSLTRAVQELVVLHSRPLPKDLRSRSRQRGTSS
jgi:DNA helicase IV